MENQKRPKYTELVKGGSGLKLQRPETGTRLEPGADGGQGAHGHQDDAVA